MPINRVAFGVLALTCVAAAGGGAYLATKQNQAATQGTSTVVEALPIPEASSTVAETETIIEEAPRSGEQPQNAEATPTQVETPAARRSKPATSRTPARSSAATRPRERSSSTTAATRNSRADERVSSAPESTSNPDRSVANSNPAPIADPTPRLAEALPESVVVPVAVESRPPIPEKTFEDLIVATDSVLGLQIETALTSEKARLEDRVEARVTRDVKVDNAVAIPAGSRVEGSVTLVEKGGKVKERARLGIRFHTLVLADGTKVALNTDTLYRDGASPAGESTAKIGGAAVGGAILGAILGGGKGATIGGAVGAAGGTAAVMAGDRNAATLPAGSTVTVRILSPVTVTVER